MSGATLPFDSSIAAKDLVGFHELAVWRRNDERAPHKPLLALWAIGRCLQGKGRLVEYVTVHDELARLLKKFGRPRKRQKPYEPFWRMQKDGVWHIPEADRVTEHSNGSVSPTELSKLQISGGLPIPIFNLFREDRTIALKVSQELVRAHFPETLQRSVLEATLGESLYDNDMNVDRKVDNSELLESVRSRRRRNPVFRRNVLKAYRYRCAICCYSLEFPLEEWPALEAAHIKWHSHHGPDETQNGLSLCALHHELFDWGAFTVLPGSFDVIVASQLIDQGAKKWVQDFHGRPLSVQADQDTDCPAPEFLKWYAKNVFKDLDAI